MPLSWNASSAWPNLKDRLFLSTCWCISIITRGLLATRDIEIHQRVLRKSQTFKLGHAEKLQSYRTFILYFIFSWNFLEGKNQPQRPKTDPDGFNQFPEDNFKPIPSFRHHRAGPINIPNRRSIPNRRPIKVIRILGGKRQKRPKLI